MEEARRSGDQTAAGWALNLLAYVRGYAEAMEAYHDLRGRLRDQLGVDPSADLQDLYRRLLTGESRLDSSRRCCSCRWRPCEER